MSDTVTLDSMIRRDDFALVGPDTGESEPIKTLSIENMSSSGMFISLLRKPDFQRETNHWTPHQIVSFLESFLDNELIPSVILWKSQSYVFVIDGAHRLSALRAWIEDDYGDKEVSRKYFSNDISKSQLKIAKKTRDLIQDRIGTYKEIKDALLNPDAYSDVAIQRARNMAIRSISLQWVSGDSAKAESSFFKINTKGTPLDATEELVLRNRYKSVAIASRSIVRAATGHKYWSKFSAENKEKIEENAKLVHHALFNPEVDSPIKTLDLPIGGSKSPLSALEMLMKLISVTNANNGEFEKILKDFNEDETGQETLNELQKCNRIVSRVSGNQTGSLGLHPAIYFYSDRGRHLPDLLLGILLLFRQKIQNNDSNFFKKFTSSRPKIEEFLIDNKAIIVQSLQLSRSKTRYIKVKDAIEYIVNTYSTGDSPSVEEVIKVIAPNSTRIFAVSESETGKNFSTDAKSAIFIKQALQSAMKCPICNGYLDASKSGSYDHIERVQDGGQGNAHNGQITHPYCNDAVKN